LPRHTVSRHLPAGLFLFQNELAVHGKKDGVCPTCGERLIVTKVVGRGTYFCPNCQK